MPNNPNIPDTGRIQQDPSRTGKSTELEYKTNERFEDKFGATVGQPPGDEATERAMRDAAVASKATKRSDLANEKLPDDPLDPEFGKDRIPEN